MTTGETPEPQPLEPDYILHQVLDPSIDGDITKRRRGLWEKNIGLAVQFYGVGDQRALDEVLGPPAFLDSLSIADYNSADSFRQAAADELEKRFAQKVYYDRLNTVVEQANTASDMVAITDTYLYLYSQSGRGPKSEIGPFGQLLTKMFGRAGELCEDPTEGTAAVESIVAIVLPAVQRFTDSPVVAQAYKNGPGSYVASQLHKQLAYGSAEYVAGLRIRSTMHDQGYRGFGVEGYEQIEANLPSDYCLTTKAIRFLWENGYITNSRGYPTERPELPSDKGAILRACQLIEKALLSLAEDPRYPNANPIKQIYEARALRVAGSSTGRTIQPFKTINELGNAVIPSLEQRYPILKGLMDRVEEGELENTAFAFRRILYFIDPDLFVQSRHGSLYDGNQWRMLAAATDAMMDMWAVFRRNRGRVVGDLVMQLLAAGVEPVKITGAVQNELDELGNIDQTAANTYGDMRRRLGRLAQARFSVVMGGHEHGGSNTALRSKQ